jgi:hypothetical protein
MEQLQSKILQIQQYIFLEQPSKATALASSIIANSTVLEIHNAIKDYIRHSIQAQITKATKIAEKISCDYNTGTELIFNFADYSIFVEIEAKKHFEGTSTSLEIYVKFKDTVIMELEDIDYYNIITFGECLNPIVYYIIGWLHSDVQQFSHPYYSLSKKEALLLIPNGGVIYASKNKKDLQPFIAADVLAMITNAEHLTLDAETSIVCLQGYGERHYAKLDAEKVKNYIANLQNQ